MNKNILVSVPVWAESAKSWNILVKKGHAVGAWSCAYWFPKSLCTLDLKEGVLTVPSWLIEKLGISEIVTYKY